ncbi:MAG: LL-diaminopimelate aminotransferase, partial [Candidatus Omnitrophica bacterium]|nr:LL-diaminopimelate aminotransferase [Candidatus Omnitrophota bacterium]
DVIDLAVGDPDLATPPFIVDALNEAARDPSNHRYALDAGMPAFRESVCNWFEKRFHVKLDPAAEILPLIGSKEGIAHLPLAIVNPQDVVLVPDPCYPPYRSGTWFAGGIPHLMPLLEGNDFLPDLGIIAKDVLKKSKLMFLNYPNNPTSAVASKEFFRRAVEFAHEHRILIAHDAAYSEVGFDGYQAPSILEVEGAREVSIEFHSLSKMFNMTGWRVGFAVGNAKALSLLGKVKSNIDSGIFQAVQLAAKKALDEGHETHQDILKIYQKRRDLFVNGLKKMGWEVQAPKATFYCWISVPSGYTSSELVMKFLDTMNIIITPGNGFGMNGEGYFRVSLTVPEARLEEALKRIEQSHHHFHSK